MLTHTFHKAKRLLPVYSIKQTWTFQRLRRPTAILGITNDVTATTLLNYYDRITAKNIDKYL